MRKKNWDAVVYILFFLVVSLMLIKLLITNDIQNYVHPRFNIYLWITSFVLILITISFIRMTFEYKHGFQIKINILMILVFIFVVVFPTSAPITTRVETQKIATKTEKSLLEKYYSEENLIIRNEDYLKWFYDLNTNLDKYIDKKVTYNAKIFDKYEDYYLPIRNIMVCCAADLAALGIRNENPNHIEIPEKGKWVRIDGIIKKRYMDQFKSEIPYIEMTKIEEISSIKNEILYP